jgi:hypothetical protein
MGSGGTCQSEGETRRTDTSAAGETAGDIGEGDQGTLRPGDASGGGSEADIDDACERRDGSTRPMTLSWGMTPGDPEGGNALSPRRPPGT